MELDDIKEFGTDFSGVEDWELEQLRDKLQARYTAQLNAVESEMRRRWDPQRRSRALFEFIRPELDEEIRAEKKRDLQQYVHEGGMRLVFAAEQAGLSVEDFTREMEENGLSIPDQDEVDARLKKRFGQS